MTYIDNVITIPRYIASDRDKISVMFMSLRKGTPIAKTWNGHRLIGLNDTETNMGKSKRKRQMENKTYPNNELYKLYDKPCISVGDELKRL